MVKKYSFELNYPVDMMQHTVTQEHGERPETYKKYIVGGKPLQGHNGTDFGPYDGMSKPFWPIDDGTVIGIWWDPLGYGNYLDVMHTWGRSRYAHAQAIYVREGDRVVAPRYGKQGTYLGKTGTTGFSTGVHLHLGIYPALELKSNGFGGTIDPRQPDNYFVVPITGTPPPVTPPTAEPPVVVVPVQPSLPTFENVIVTTGPATIVAPAGAMFRHSPSIQAENVLRALPYGTRVEVVNDYAVVSGGVRFRRVRHEWQEGWVAEKGVDGVQILKNTSGKFGVR